MRAAGIKFKNLGLLNLSLMHRSVSNEIGKKLNNERLEFLGDAVLGAVTATLLYNRLGGRPEGDMAKIKSAVVSEDVLAAVALEIQIDGLLLLGKGEEITGGRGKKTILADAMEALIGALYLDSGYKAAFAFVQGFMDNEISGVLENRRYRDYKSLLQEYCQRVHHSYPIYRVIKKTGPEHDKLYWMEVTVKNKTYGPATGRNKKTAEQAAAKAAMDEIEKVKS